MNCHECLLKFVLITRRFRSARPSLFAISSLDVKGIYIVSPNVRLEKGIQSDKHLLEFSQLDMELRNASAEDFRSLVEDMMIHLFTRVKSTCRRELMKLNSEIRTPRKPLPIYSSWKLRNKFGPKYESQISHLEDSLFWITDFEREFYDREDSTRKGHYVNFDLFFPEGYGEALSGGERDFEYEILVRKILERNQNPADFKAYLDFAKAGLLCPSVGGGLGIERLVRFLTKRPYIKEITLFPKVPGETIHL